MTIDYSHSQPTQRPGSPLLVVLAWAVVGIPALWGIAMTGRTAMQLFHAPPAHSAAASTTAPATGK
jgi:hypothetical protein